MRSEHGNKPWTTHFKHVTLGDMVTDQRLLASIALISQDLEEALSLLEESPSLSSMVSASSSKMKENLMQLSTELCQQSAQFSTIVRSMV